MATENVAGFDDMHQEFVRGNVAQLPFRQARHTPTRAQSLPATGGVRDGKNDPARPLLGGADRDCATHQSAASAHTGF